MLYQLCCYKDRDPASSGFLITPAIYWRELYLKKTLAMHGTISASLHAGICIVREAPSQMDLLVRAFPGSPCWLMARGGSGSCTPNPALVEGTQGEPHQCCCHMMPWQHAASHHSTALRSIPAPGWGWILVAAAAAHSPLGTGECSPASSTIPAC